MRQRTLVLLAASNLEYAPAGIAKKQAEKDFLKVISRARAKGVTDGGINKTLRLSKSTKAIALLSKKR